MIRCTHHKIRIRRDVNDAYSRVCDVRCVYKYTYMILYTCLLYNIHRTAYIHKHRHTRTLALSVSSGRGGTPEGKSETTGPAETTQRSPRSTIIMGRYLGAVYIFTHIKARYIKRKTKRERNIPCVYTLYIYNKEVKTITLVA